MRKFISAYSYLFLHIRRICVKYLGAYEESGESIYAVRRMRGKYLSVYGDYGECRVVCGTQNRL
jgi:hypothetical protein